MTHLTARLRHGLIDVACGAIAMTGADVWLAPLTAGLGIVLTMHRVRPPSASTFAPNASLEITPKGLTTLLDEISAAGLEIIPIDAVLDRVRTPSGRRFAALTFDDGYRDNLEIACPILAAKGVPWTLFVVSDYLKGRGRAWWLELESAVTALDRIEVDGGDRTLVMPSSTPKQKHAAFEILRRILHDEDEARRIGVLEQLRASAGLDWNGLVSSNFASAEDVRKMANGGNVTIGSHTSSHQVLSRSTTSVATDEIADSRVEICKMLGHDIRHIAFPHGDRASIGERESILAADAGYRSAWTTNASPIFFRHLADPWSLPRVSVNGRHVSKSMFRAVLSGAAFPHARLSKTRRGRPDVDIPYNSNGSAVIRKN